MKKCQVFRVLLIVFFGLLISLIEGYEGSFEEEEKDAYYKWFDMNRRNFDKEELASRYRKMARKYHPDKNKEKGAEETFYKISKAFDVLNDDEKRARYDVGGPKAVDDGASGAYQDHSAFANDIFRKMFEGFFDGSGGGDFGSFFGGGGRSRKGPSSKTEVEVSLETLFGGGSVQLEYSRVKVCGSCEGSGAHNPKEVKQCTKCRGQGAYLTVQQVAPGFVQQVQRTCEVCQGRGKTFSKACKVCNGQRVSRGAEKLRVDIAAGARDQEALVFEGMADEHPEREAGDIIVILRTKEHSFYRRDGNNLYCRVPISLKQALLGFKVTISQLDGSPLRLERNEVTQSGQVIRIAGMGMSWNSKGKKTKGRGDLFVEYQVILPTSLSSKQSKEFASLLAGSTESTYKYPFTASSQESHDEL